MDELLGRRIPQNQQAEQAVLGAMLIDPDCIPDVLKTLKPEHFYSQTNRDIFETFLNMFTFGKVIDPVTVLEQLRARGAAKEDSRDYFARLIEMTPTSANVEEYAEIVRDLSLQRELGQAAQSILDMVNQGLGGANEMLEFAERTIYALRQDRTVGGLKPLSEIMQTVYETLSLAADSDSSLPGLSTGLSDLDRAILGLNPGELVLVASRPGMGKTSIAMNIALSAARSGGKTVAVFSLEMSREQLAMRVLSSESLVAVKKLMQGDLNNDEWQRVLDAASRLSEVSILIDDNPTLSVSDMNAQCRRVKNLGLVVIDYLQLMQSAGGGRHYASENRQQVVSDISRMLKIMAKELGIPVLCLSQLSRASEKRDDKRPMLSDLRESGAIEQDADVVIGLYRESYYNEECEDPGAAEAIILKNRKGETGKIYLRWIAEYTSYAGTDNVHSEY